MNISPYTYHWSLDCDFWCLSGTSSHRVVQVFKDWSFDGPSALVVLRSQIFGWGAVEIFAGALFRTDCFPVTIGWADDPFRTRTGRVQIPPWLTLPPADLTRWLSFLLDDSEDTCFLLSSSLTSLLTTDLFLLVLGRVLMSPADESSLWTSDVLRIFRAFFKTWSSSSISCFSSGRISD